MAAGRPVLATMVGEARDAIEDAGCGLCCDAEDSRGLAEVIRRFADMGAEERAAMGARGRRYYEAHFSRERFFGRLEGALASLAEGGSHGIG